MKKVKRCEYLDLDALYLITVLMVCFTAIIAVGSEC